MRTFECAGIKINRSAPGRKSEGIDESTDSGFGVRVLVEARGFFFEQHGDEERVEGLRAPRSRCQANRAIQRMPVELETLPVSRRMDHADEVNPFAVSIEEKVSRLLAVNEAARKAGPIFAVRG